jgi:hypothetical protein
MSIVPPPTNLAGKASLKYEFGDFPGFHCVNEPLDLVVK